MSADRVDVRKTYKLYLGGAFPRSESGRVLPATDADGNVLARVAHASRKDLRDAVRAARGAQPGWAGRTAYNRGQVLYRIAEMVEDRRGTFVDQLMVDGRTGDDAAGEVDASIDRIVWYAGWADKYAQVMGNLNPVAGPYFTPFLHPSFLPSFRQCLAMPLLIPLNGRLFQSFPLVPLLFCRTIMKRLKRFLSSLTCSGNSAELLLWWVRLPARCADFILSSFFLYRDNTILTTRKSLSRFSFTFGISSLGMASYSARACPWSRSHPAHALRRGFNRPG